MDLAYDNISIFHQIWNTYNFQIEFWLWKLRSHNIIQFYIVDIFNIVFYGAYIRWQSNLVSIYNKSMLIRANEISHNFWFDILEGSI